MQVKRVSSAHHSSWHLNFYDGVVWESIDAASREEILRTPRSVQDLEKYRDGWRLKANTVDSEFAGSLHEAGISEHVNNG